jgi:hypothetical protein
MSLFPLLLVLDLSTDARLHVYASPYGIFGGQSGTGRGCPLFWFFPVSIILPMLHIHSFIWHWHYMILSSCQCCEMKCPSNMYKMRLKNLRTWNFITSLFTFRIYSAAARNLSCLCNWLLGRGWNILWQSMFSAWCSAVLHIHLTYWSNE